MRVFAVSDLHVDYEVNVRWVQSLSRAEYTDDALILAGDVSDATGLLASTFEALAARFRAVLFVPGNHDLWVMKGPPGFDSFQKFEQVRRLAADGGLHMTPWAHDGLAIVPLLGWYDFSFGPPADELREVWADFRACRWPAGCDEAEVTRRFLALNPTALATPHERVMTFSHFLPRIDLMPPYIPEKFRILYPVLGTWGLDAQLRQLGSFLHVYGHSHVNRHVVIDGVRYLNNAFGYPAETRIAAKQLVCVHDTAQAR